MQSLLSCFVYCDRTWLAFRFMVSSRCEPAYEFALFMSFCHFDSFSFAPNVLGILAPTLALLLPSSRIETAFPSEVSCVVFSPTDPHLLLTTSKDPVLKVWDLRNPAKPVHAFQGHTRQAKPNMYRAVFCGGGRYIASPGAGSEKLSLYRLADGKTVSRGDLGFDPSTVLVPGGGRGAEGSLLLGGKGRVVLAEPVWE